MNIKTFKLDISSPEECQKVINDLKSILGQLNRSTQLGNIKTFDVDFDCLNDILNLNNILKSRIGEIRKNKNGSRKEKFRTVFDSCINIYNTNIDDLYTELMLDETPVYYVYTHSEKGKNIAVGKDGITSFGATLGMKHIPFYVGKGTGNRANDLNRNETHRKIRKSLELLNKEISVEIIKENLTEKEALILESKLIDIFGLIPNGGKLTNLDEGIKSEERRNKYMEDLQKINPLYKKLLYNR